MIFAIMLTDFFDTMGTITGVAAEAGLAEPMGRFPASDGSLLVDSDRRDCRRCGRGSVRIRRTSRARPGVADGGRTGMTSVMTGVLFLLAILLAPIAIDRPVGATAPVLVLVGYLMFTLIKDIPVGDVEEGLPALLTMILMPLTYDITVGIGAGFISWVLIKVGAWQDGRDPLADVGGGIAFLVFFAQDWITASSSNVLDRWRPAGPPAGRFGARLLPCRMTRFAPTAGRRLRLRPARGSHRPDARRATRRLAPPGARSLARHDRACPLP